MKRIVLIFGLFISQNLFSMNHKECSDGCWCNLLANQFDNFLSNDRSDELKLWVDNAGPKWQNEKERLSTCWNCIVNLLCERATTEYPKSEKCIKVMEQYVKKYYKNKESATKMLQEHHQMEKLKLSENYRVIYSLLSK